MEHYGRPVKLQKFHGNIFIVTLGSEELFILKPSCYNLQKQFR